MFEVRFWGVRGSIATSGERVAQVGGNTSCVEVRVGSELLVLDAGTGLRALGEDLLRRDAQALAGPVRILLSHVHWDHIQGFPFFVPAYRPGTRLEVIGPGASDGALREALAAQMRPPHFPISLDVMRADLGFRAVGSGQEIVLGDVTLRTGACNHPNGCLAWRIEHGGRSIVYATDTEHRAGCVDHNLVDLARGADALIYDAQYTPAEYVAGKQGWGHSTWEEGVRLARAAGVGKLVLFHHDPSHDDAEVARIEATAAAELPGTVAAREGRSIAIDTTPVREAA